MIAEKVRTGLSEVQIKDVREKLVQKSYTIDPLGYIDARNRPEYPFLDQSRWGFGQNKRNIPAIVASIEVASIDPERTRLIFTIAVWIDLKETMQLSRKFLKASDSF